MECGRVARRDLLCRHTRRSSTPIRPGGVGMRYSLQRLALVVLIGAIARPVAAQNTLTLEGSVRYDNAPVNNAQVSVLNIETQESARAATRPTGEFRVVGLFSGRYT